MASGVCSHEPPGDAENRMLTVKTPACFLPRTASEPDLQEAGRRVGSAFPLCIFCLLVCRMVTKVVREISLTHTHTHTHSLLVKKVTFGDLGQDVLVWKCWIFVSALIGFRKMTNWIHLRICP